MRIGIVIHRYGEDVGGGAELHAKLVAEHLHPAHPVTVFTTCAKDYVTWRNSFAPGKTMVNGILVHRFKVKHPRKPHRFLDIQNRVYKNPHPADLEERWLQENGPYAPRLVQAVSRARHIDRWLLFSYRYWTTVQCLRRLGKKALLVPTAEHDPALYLDLFKPVFHLPRAIVYNSIEERELIQQASDNRDVPGDVVGVGLVEQTGAEAVSAAAKQYAADNSYIVYIGRIDMNKSCDHLFRMFRRYGERFDSNIRLLLIGKQVMRIPNHPSVDYLGYLSEADKMYLLQQARLLVMPSKYESLSMVMLEAWKAGKAVLANNRCEVLSGQCRRSNGGLAYNNTEEFLLALDLLLNNRALADTLGRQGREYYLTHYTWPAIEAKYEALLHL